jgi:hypothetical protein
MKNAFYIRNNPLNYQNVLFRMFFCYYCHKAVAIACSVTKLLTPSSILGKGEVCQLQLLLEKSKTSVMNKNI